MFGKQSILLDMRYSTYTTVPPLSPFPADGDCVSLSSALVDHRAVCPGELAQQAKNRAEGKARYERSRRT
jgi:hypothetical protein